jgi:signal transduction histidine kinase
MNSSVSSGPAAQDRNSTIYAKPEQGRDLKQNLSRRRDTLTHLAIRLSFYSSTVVFAARAIASRALDFHTLIWATTTYLLLSLACFCLVRGRQSWAGALLTHPFALGVGYALYRGGGLDSGAAAFFVPLLVWAGITLGRRGIIAFATNTLLILLTIAYLEQTHNLPSPFWTPSFLPWLELLVAMSASTALLLAVLDALSVAQNEVRAASQQQEDAETRYVAAQKLEPVAQLASGIAHDFNNLLGVIANVSSSLRSEVAQEPNTVELLDDLDEATARASLMTGQLLAFSRRRALEMEVVDLEEFVQSLTPLLARLLGDEIVVVCSGTTNQLTVHADRGQLEQVLLNLAVNARDAMPRGGRLSIETGVAGENEIYVSVRDTGVGIEEAHKSKIFSAFFTTKVTGTGLGLATVADIVERLKGSIDLESELGLPASHTPASEARRSLSRIRLRRHAAHILLAEDHELMRRATQRLLEQAGYTVTSVVNGQEALALLEGGSQFDILLTDISMPALSGIDLVERLSSSNHTIPTVFISGDGGRMPRQFESRSFKTRFLSKPFAQEDLIDAIEKILTQRSPDAAEEC